ncbi:MAG TPA: hypothetical protein VJA16_02720 [Thermoanaerobaculia bacterium]
MPARPSLGATIGRALAIAAWTALAALLRQAPLCALAEPARGADEPRPAEERTAGDESAPEPSAPEPSPAGHGAATASAADERTAAAPAAEPAAGAAPPGLAATFWGDLRGAGWTLWRTVRVEAPPRRRGQWIYLVALAGASAALEAHKEEIRRDVLRSSFYRHSAWTDFAGQAGMGKYSEGLTALLYGGGLFARAPAVRQTGLELGESLLVAQAGTAMLNFVFSERRPEAGGKLSFFRAGGSSASIHMTNTMAVARVLDHQLDHLGGPGRGARLARILARVGLYSLPAITGWERMRSDQHYAWNVLLGGGSSLYLTNAVLRAHDREEGAGAGSRLLPRVLLTAPKNGRGQGLLLAWSVD